MSRFNLLIASLFLYAVICYTCILFSCTSTNNKPLLISFSPDSTSIVFSNIDRTGLLHLNNIANQDSVLHELISVLQTPSETDSTVMESPLDGNLVLTDTNIVFTPNAPFVKGRDYLIITYLNSRFGTADEVVKSELNTRVRSHQVVLKR